MPDINKLFEKAEKYLQKQKFESALETYQEINRYQPNDEEVLLNLADLCQRFNRTSESLKYHAQLVDIYIKRNDVKALLRHFTATISRNRFQINYL